MKIVHIADIYVEGWGYQENLLPLYQKLAGHDVVVVSDNDHLGQLRDDNLAHAILSRGKEYEFDGIRIYKIKEFFTTSSTALFCAGLYRILEREKPDMIFQHNLNLSTLTVAARYKKRHPTIKLYVDSHSDWVNESKNRLWHLLYCKCAIPIQVKRLGDRVDYYFGVSPLRCDYLEKVFCVPQNKIKFLPIGCDTRQAEQVSNSGEELREKYGIPADSFVVTSGGKLDRSKGTIELINACESLRSQGISITLVLFGRMDDEVSAAIQGKAWIKSWGWCDRLTTVTLLKMADVACWPCFHTTLIEDAIAAGTPIIVKDSDNVSHFMKEKTGVFLKKSGRDELTSALLHVKNNLPAYRDNVATAKKKYSYAMLIKQLDEESFYDWQSGINH